MKKTAVIILFVLSVCKLLGQDITIQEIETISGNNSEMIFSNSTAIRNNKILVAGYFLDTLTIENATIYSPNKQSGFIAKYDTSYNLTWLKKIESSKRAVCKAISIDGNNDIIVGGLFLDTLIVNGDSLFSKGLEDIFILKLNQSGSLVWSVSVNVRGFTEIYDLETDINNNIYFSGFFQDSLFFDFDTLISTQYSYDGMLFKLSPDGSEIWAQQYSGVGTQYVYDISIDNDNLWTCGSFTDTIKVQDSNLISNGCYDGFLINFNTDGLLLNMGKVGGKRDDAVKSIDTKNNKAYFTGEFQDTIIINDIVFPANADISTDGIDAYCAKANQNLEIEWFVPISGDRGDFASSILLQNNNCLFVSGYCMSFNSYIGDTVFHGGQGQDSYFAKFDSLGNFISALFLDSDFSSASLSLLSDFNNVYYFGYYRKNLEINNYYLSTNTHPDIFMIKINSFCEDVNIINNEISREISIYPNPCSSYFIIDSDELPNKVNIWNSSGELISSSANQIRFKVDGYPPGIYYVQVIFDNSQLIKKVLIHKY
jgi:hypothetical protein